MPPVLVFTKAPIIGQVKTRLMPHFNALEATQIHTELVTHTLEKFSVFPLQLWCSPDTTHPFFLACQQQYKITLHQQIDGDLGEKMGMALAQTLQHHSCAVLVGTDSPVLQPSHIQRAFEQLHQGMDVVVTPTEDGGFCMIGLSKYHPHLFTKINWGSAHVFEQLKRNLAQLAWYFSIQETLWDIDHPEDYQRYKNNRE